MKNIYQIFIFLLVIFSRTSFSQGHVGGGDSYASEFQQYINRLDSYLLSAEGKRLFPEIKQPDFHEIINQVRPVVKNERVYDSYGIAQTCISSIEENNRFFQCDLSRLPENNVNNQPALYRLVFHELLFQVGLEVPISRDVPSDFRISSRLKLYMATYDEWLPGEMPGGWKDLSVVQKACEIYALNEKNIWIQIESSDLNAIECLIQASQVSENYNSVDLIFFDRELSVSGRTKIRK